ncbi:hypothetical protein ACFT7S_30960 [Streptomyces sp. NPDC057136]|uniref:hypothetical protein n=1 Tax=Streptomyces sp. NPDC057136 TaxID=3346029 RepID=UPI003642BEB0
MRSATTTAAQHMGVTLGLALFGTVLTARLRHVNASDDAFTGQLLGGYTDTLWWAIGGMLIAGLTAGLMVTAKAPRCRTPGARAGPVSDRLSERPTVRS